MGGVEVIDAMPGTGKTTYAFQLIREDTEGKYVYCSPYLSEVGDGARKGRVHKEVPGKNFVAPSSPSKMKSLERLLSQGRNVSITHSLLSSTPLHVAELIHEKGYKLVLDETLQPISVFQDLSPEDISILVDSNRVVVKDNGGMEWNHDQHPSYRGRDERIKELCDKGSLFAPVGLSSLLEVMHSSVITCFREVKILTYLFEGSIMSSWMKLKQIPYSYVDSSLFHNPQEHLEALRRNLEFLEPSRTIKNLQKREGEDDKKGLSPFLGTTGIRGLWIR